MHEIINLHLEENKNILNLNDIINDHWFNTLTGFIHHNCILFNNEIYQQCINLLEGGSGRSLYWYYCERTISCYIWISYKYIDNIIMFYLNHNNNSSNLPALYPDNLDLREYCLISNVINFLENYSQFFTSIRSKSIW